MREQLIDRMIRIYGFENPIIIRFCKLCEVWDDTEEMNRSLEMIVKSHEKYPNYNNEEEEDA